jgi:hypothetical protein
MIIYAYAKAIRTLDARDYIAQNLKCDHQILFEELDFFFFAVFRKLLVCMSFFSPFSLHVHLGYSRDVQLPPGKQSLSVECLVRLQELTYCDSVPAHAHATTIFISLMNGELQQQQRAEHM